MDSRLCVKYSLEFFKGIYDVRIGINIALLPYSTQLLRVLDRLLGVVGRSFSTKIIRYFHQEKNKEETLMKKGIIYKLSPFNNETEMSALQYVIKKVIAFILIYGVSAVLGEGIIIGTLYAMGYDPLQGVMPTGEISAGCISQSISFCGFNTNIDYKVFILWIVAFCIQGATEEIMCRGFLLNILKEKVFTDENKHKAKKV